MGKHVTSWWHVLSRPSTSCHVPPRLGTSCHVPPRPLHVRVRIRFTGRSSGRRGLSRRARFRLGCQSRAQTSPGCRTRLSESVLPSSSSRRPDSALRQQPCPRLQRTNHWGIPRTLERFPVPPARQQSAQFGRQGKPTPLLGFAISVTKGAERGHCPVPARTCVPTLQLQLLLHVPLIPPSVLIPNACPALPLSRLIAHLTAARSRLDRACARTHSRGCSDSPASKPLELVDPPIAGEAESTSGLCCWDRRRLCDRRQGAERGNGGRQLERAFRRFPVCTLSRIVQPCSIVHLFHMAILVGGTPIPSISTAIWMCERNKF